MKTLYGTSALLVLLVAVAFAQEAKLKPGLLGEYYDMEEAIEDYPKIPADKKPTIKLIDKEINFESTTDDFGNSKISEHLFVRWTGVIKAPKDGKYTLYVESDDGARLFIDGKQIIDNNGLHGMFEKSAALELKAGDHDIRIDYFENEGEAGLKLSWSTQGIDKQIVPASALFHKADPDLDKDK